jgi:cytochrome c-type biogenesis protein CcmH/NrfF
MRAEVAKLLDEGKTREEVYQYFIAQYGSQEPLGAPIDKGFNRLAWFFPYLVGASGALAVVFVARKWASRKEDDLPAAAGVPEDPAMRSRLDDELRDLD